MPNAPILEADTDLRETLTYRADFPASVADLAALWHESEDVLNRGDYPDHMMNMLTGSQEKLMQRVIHTACSTDEDLAAKLMFAAFIVKSDWGGSRVEEEIIDRIAADYERMREESRAFAADQSMSY
jgi:hypothetical protein